MWSSDGFSFEAKYYEVTNAFCVPKPTQKPHPPILIGGGGEKMTLRLVAENGDACNITGGVTMVRHKLGMLRKHCMAVGRDYGEILKTKLGHLIIARDTQEARSIAEGGVTPQKG